MSDDKDKNTNDNDKQNNSNEPKQNNSNEPKPNNSNEQKQNQNDESDLSNQPGSSGSMVIIYENTENAETQADIAQSESEILNFFANYGKTEGAFLPYIPTTEAFVYMKIPPDGGYAWVILLISVANCVCIDGTMFCVGRVLPDITRDLEISSSTGSLIISIQIGLYYACGPISSILVNRLGFRRVAIIGICMAAFGNIIASFSKDVLYLFIFFGIMVGFGCGMSVLAAQMIVSFYFARFRAIACGICSAGSGLGVLIFSPLNHYVVTRAGWRIQLRMQAAVCCLVMILSIFYQPVQLTKIGKYVEKPLKEEETLDSLNSIEIAYDRYSKFLTVQTPERDGSISQSTNLMHSINRPNYSPPTQKSSLIKKIFSKCCNCFKKTSSPKTNMNNITNMNNVSERKPSIVEKQIPTAVTSTVPPTKIIIDVAPLDREDIFYSGNPNFRETINKLDDENITVLPGKESKAVAINYTISVSRNLAAEYQSEHKTTSKQIFPHITLSSKVLAAFNLLFDPKLLHSKEFGVLFAANFFNFFGVNIPFIYLSDHTEIPPDYSNLLLSTIGLLNIILRIFAGMLAFYYEVNPLQITGVALICGGLFTLLIGFIGKSVIWFQFLYCLVFSIGSAFSSSFRSIIIVQLLGLDKLTNAYGFTALGMGIASFLGTICGGLVETYTGSTDFAFAFAGISIFISGLLINFLHLVVKILCSDDTDNIKRVRFSTIDARRR